MTARDPGPGSDTPYGTGDDRAHLGESLRDVMSGLSSDPLTWDADALERVIHAALRDGDMEAVAAALRLLIVKDFARGERMYDTLQLGLALAGRGRG